MRQSLESAEQCEGQRIDRGESDQLIAVNQLNKNSMHCDNMMRLTHREMSNAIEPYLAYISRDGRTIHTIAQCTHDYVGLAQARPSDTVYIQQQPIKKCMFL